MLKIRALSLTALTLPLMLAACGQPALPAQAVPQASLVKVRVNSLGLARTFGAAALKAQGLPSDGHGGLPAMQMKVTVRDSQNAVVAFSGGAYDPSGQGDQTLTLDASTGFGTTVLLPAGTYSFENAAVDAGGQDILLAYGPGAENTQQVDADHGTVMLKFHAVIDAAQSKLDFATDTHTVYTNDAFNLRLYAKSSPVNGVTYDIPTSDLKMAAPAYTLGSDLEGTLNGTGSTLGVNVTALGSLSPDETVLKVTPHLQAWVRTPGTDAASLQDVLLPTFQGQIKVGAGLHTDVAAPHNVTLNAPGETPTNVALTLSGTALDDVAVQSLRLYADQNLIASTDPADTDAGVPSLTTDSSGHWSASWTPMTLGKHELTMVATDSSGNETQATQTASAVAYVTLPFNGYNDGYFFSNYASLTLAAHADIWIKADLSACGYCRQNNTSYVQAGSSDPSRHLPDEISIEASTSRYGSILSPTYSYAYSYNAYSYLYKSYAYDSLMFYHIKNVSDVAKTFDFYYGD